MSLSGVNEILSSFSTFTVRFGWHSVLHVTPFGICECRVFRPKQSHIFLTAVSKTHSHIYRKSLWSFNGAKLLARYVHCVTGCTTCSVATVHTVTTCSVLRYTQSPLAVLLRYTQLPLAVLLRYTQSPLAVLLRYTQLPLAVLLRYTQLPLAVFLRYIQSPIAIHRTCKFLLLAHYLSRYELDGQYHAPASLPPGRSLRPHMNRRPTGSQ